MITNIGIENFKVFCKCKKFRLSNLNIFAGINGPLDREYQLVGFFDGGFMTGHNHLDPEIMNTYLWIIRDYVEVVGNKYQNAELLEKDKDYYINWLKENENDEFISHI